MGLSRDIVYWDATEEQEDTMEEQEEMIISYDSYLNKILNRFLNRCYDSWNGVEAWTTQNKILPWFIVHAMHNETWICKTTPAYFKFWTL